MIQYMWYSICDTVYVIQYMWYSTVYVKEVLTAMPYTDRNIANKCKLNLATPAKKSLSPRQNVLFMQYMSTHIYFTQKYILYISFCLNMNNMLRRGRRKSAIKKMIWKKRSGEIRLYDWGGGCSKPSGIAGQYVQHFWEKKYKIKPICLIREMPCRSQRTDLKSSEFSEASSFVQTWSLANWKFVKPV